MYISLGPFSMIELDRSFNFHSTIHCPQKQLRLLICGTFTCHIRWVIFTFFLATSILCYRDILRLLHNDYINLDLPVFSVLILIVCKVLIYY